MILHICDILPTNSRYLVRDWSQTTRHVHLKDYEPLAAALVIIIEIIFEIILRVISLNICVIMSSVDLPEYRPGNALMNLKNDLSIV